MNPDNAPAPAMTAEPEPTERRPTVAQGASTFAKATADKMEGKPFNELSVLFPLLSLYTAGYLGLMAAEFFLGVVKAPSGMMPIYVALLGRMRRTVLGVRCWVVGFGW